MDENVAKLISRVGEVAEQVTDLYDPIDSLIVPNCNVRLVRRYLQLWTVDAGRSGESAVDRDTFQKLTTILNSMQNPYLVRLVFAFDIHSFLDAIIDRVSSLDGYLRYFYTEMSTRQTHSVSAYTNTSVHSDVRYDQLLSIANMTYVSMASSFDLLTKLVLELNGEPQRNYATYSKKLMCSADKTYTTGLKIDERFKQDGSLFMEPENPRIKEVVQLRSEYVHNGPWDRRAALYTGCINGEPVDEFMLMPDVNADGSLVSFSGRRTFYSQSRKLNVELFKTVEEIVEIISNTLTVIKNFTMEKLGNQEGLDQTEYVIAAIKELNQRVKDSQLVDGTNSLLLYGSPIQMITTGFKPDIRSLMEIYRKYK